MNPVSSLIDGAVQISASTGHEVLVCVKGNLEAGKVEQSCQVRHVSSEA